MNIGISCNNVGENTPKQNKEFDYFVDQFADLRILRYQIPAFEKLSAQQKEMLYYLSQAALCGRDIMFDQNGKYNLLIRLVLETIYLSYKGDRNKEEFKNFEVYLKRIWFSNGIYHHYSTDKIKPDFSKEYFLELIDNSNKEKLLAGNYTSIEALTSTIIPVIFDPEVLPKKVNQDPSKDLVTHSAVNFYQGVNQQEVEAYYKRITDTSDRTPISFGLNSQVVKENGEVKERVWKIDGMYGPAIEKIVSWLRKAKQVAENEKQASVIATLIDYFHTGDLETFDEYSIKWVQDTASQIDFINGFIEVYSDPLGLKGTWESVVNFKDIEATKRTRLISNNAQWFEDHSPVDERFKKKNVKGVTAKVITVVQLGGDCYPATPIGINLPNAEWIRAQHGSKSVTMNNITNAYDQANLKTGFLEEFSVDKEEIKLIRKYGPLASNIHVDLHECLGHGSGRMLPGVSTDALKNYYSPLEETRADLFALYYIMDPKMVELGLLPNLDAAKAEYKGYIRNGLMTQLTRIEFGKDIEQAHMRNRQTIAAWCYEKGKGDHVIEKITRKGETYYKINDFEKLRELFGKLLAEVQRIKSEGDYEAGKRLIETYGVKIDRDLHKEVLDRYAKLNLAPYSGFINPELVPLEEDGKIIDVKVNYSNDYTQQMLKYSREYSFLPVEN